MQTFWFGYFSGMESSPKTKVLTERIILGIDPGTNIMGYGVIKVIGKEVKLLTMGVIELGKYEDHAVRLKKIFSRTLGLIEEYMPDEMAIEAPFFGKNVQSMLKLGRAQGVAIAAALYRDIPTVEYEPKKIKQSITGNGNAAKEQVAFMLQKALKFVDMPKYLDATDGLAAAMCHYYKTSSVQASGGAKSWKAFISENQERVLSRDLKSKP